MPKTETKVYFGITFEELNELAEDDVGRELTREEMQRVEDSLINDGSCTEFIGAKIRAKIRELY